MMAWNIAPKKMLWCTGWGDDGDTEIYVSKDGFRGESFAEGIGIFYHNNVSEFIDSEISRYNKEYGNGSLYDT